ncbi:MAG: hypothetical protein DYG98_26105 [Haliscomenobacteraceae bacterium CHB4]|nr:hypothetical protein [Haliscomenobacteraceae bacterium CHB4]
MRFIFCLADVLQILQSRPRPDAQAGGKQQQRSHQQSISPGAQQVRPFKRLNPDGFVPFIFLPEVRYFRMLIGINFRQIQFALMFGAGFL